MASASARKESVYAADEWWSAEQYASEFIRKECLRLKITPEQVSDDDVKQALTEHILSSPLFTIRNYYHTVNKRKDVVLIDPFNGQLLIDVAAESQRKNGYAQRVIMIKPRQMGSTTWLLARGMWHGQQPNNTIVIMVPDDEVAKSINKRIGDMYNNLGWMTPMRRIENQKQIMFSNPDSRTRDFIKGLDSQFIVVVPGPMRGLTPNVAILSEFAHVEDNSSVDAMDMLDGLLSGMSAGPESAVFIDTTANGYDDVYFPMVEDAIKRNKKWAASWERKTPPTRAEIVSGAFGQPDRPGSGWVPVFEASHWHEEYRTRDESPLGQRPRMTPQEKQHLVSTLGKKEEFGGDEEIELRDRYGATLGHLGWRRWKLENDIAGYDFRQKLLTYRQEYPTSWESCFVDYGSIAFDPLGMDVLSRQVRPPTARGMLEEGYKHGLRTWEVDQTFNSDWEEMRFWAPSEPNEQYVIGGDLGWSFETMDADETVLQVIRRRDRKQVAVYEGRVPMHRVRQRAKTLYDYFNRAYTGIETKGPGKDVVFELFQMGLTNQYHWKRLDMEVPEDSKWLGWETSEYTRPRMEGIAVEYISRRIDGKPVPDVIIRDAKLLKQMQTVKRDTTGKIKARSGAHDDHLDAWMMALAIDRDPLNPYLPPRAVQQKAIEGTLYSYQRLMAGKSLTRNNPNLRDL